MKAIQIIEMMAAEEAEDMAANFVEQALGRHDWLNNWKRLKEKKEEEQRIRAWIGQYQIETDPQSIISVLDMWATGQHRQWTA